MARPLSRGVINTRFKAMRIDHPGVQSLVAACDGAREGAREAPYEDKAYIDLFAPSHTGKSTAIKFYIENHVVPELIAEGLFPADMPVREIAKLQTRVIHVTLTEKATRKSMYADILHRLGDERAHKGGIEDLRMRAYDYLADKRVELLILDEIQHLSQGVVKKIQDKNVKQLMTQGTEVTDALKNMMIHGLVPMLLSGIPEARVHLAVDEQFTNRNLEMLDFSPLQWSNEEHQTIFEEYCGELGVLIAKQKLLPEASDFLSGGIPHMLWAASGGRLGLASRIGEEAVFHAAARGASQVHLEDLALAVDTRAIPNKYCLYNPFRMGVIEMSVGQ